MDATVERCCENTQAVSQSLNAITQPALIRVSVCDTYADPGVFECIGGRHSLGRVNGQHLIDQVFGLGGHCVPLWRGKLFNDRHNENHLVTSDTVLVPLPAVQQSS